MNTIVKALKGLYAKLGGSADVSNIDTTAEMIEKNGDVLAEIGEKVLPSATNNNDVLTVVSGKWAGAAPQHVNNDFRVELTMEMVEDTPVFSADKRVNEILAAKASGKNIITWYDNGEHVTEVPLTAYGASVVSFGCITADQDSHSSAMLSVLGVSGGEVEPDTWTVYTD